MKNKIILVLFPLVTAIHAGLFSQNNLNLLDSGKSWSTLEHMPWYPTYKITYINKFTGDTIIDGNLYKKIWQTTEPDSTNWLKVGYIREDTNGQIFARNNWGNEGLIYDFTLDAGDAIDMNNPFGVPFTTTILEVDSVMIEPLGEYRKRIILASADPAGNDETWIEGIGSLAGILRSGLHALSLTGSVWDLLCEWDGEELIYHSSWTECYYTTVGINETADQTEFLKIYPLPLKYRSTMMIKKLPGINHTLEIYNQNGSLIYLTKVKSGDQISLSKNHFSSGIYLVILRSEGNLLVSTKLIVQ